MKEMNVIRRFENGWVVGLSDGNRILVETPSGDVVEPYYGSGHRMLGVVQGDEVIEIKDAAVVTKVETLWKRKEQAYERALAHGDLDPVDGDLSESEGDGETHTLEELGFDGDTVQVADI